MSNLVSTRRCARFLLFNADKNKLLLVQMQSPPGKGALEAVSHPSGLSTTIDAQHYAPIGEGFWITPGGRIEAGDPSPREAALRELDEECGICPADVITSVHFKFIHRHRLLFDNQLTELEEFYFAGQLKECASIGKPAWTDEEHEFIKATEWVSVDQLHLYNCRPVFMGELVEKAIHQE